MVHMLVVGQVLCADRVLGRVFGVACLCYKHRMSKVTLGTVPGPLEYLAHLVVLPRAQHPGGGEKVRHFFTAMEDERRLELDRLVMQYELRWFVLDSKRHARDSRLCNLERKIRECAATCNDPVMKCARLVNGLWYFGPNDK